MFDKIKTALEQSIADLQAEVGVLFTLKAKILRLPDPPRAGLLAEQTGLEDRVAKLLATLGNLKGQIPATPSLLKMSELSAYQGLITQGFNEARNAVDIRQEILRHTDRVASATGETIVRGATKPGPRVDAWTALTAIILAGIAGYRMGKNG